MSRNGDVRFKAVHYLMLCVLLVMAFVFSGCGGSGDDFGSNSADAPGVASGSISSDSAASGSAPGDAGSSGSDIDITDVPAGNGTEDLTEQDAAGEDGIPEEQSISAGPEEQSISADPEGQSISAHPEEQSISADPEGQSISADPDAGQDVQEIIAKPAGRKGPLPEIYDPNPDYDKYALVEYAIEDIGAEFTATVSAEDDDSEFEVHCTLGRTEQVVILDADCSVVYDQTGEMGSDAALIVQQALEENNWSRIGE